MSHGRTWITAGVCLLALMAAQADTVVFLPDPTRPPGSVRTPGAGGAATRGGSASSSLEPAAVASAPVVIPRRLTGIRMSASGEGLAMIDGQLVGVGGRVGDATVMSIDHEQVVLRNTQGQHKHLSLTPTATKTATGGKD